MNRHSTLAVVLAVSLAAAYGYLAASGIHAALLFQRGIEFYRSREYEAAAPLLERAATGSFRLRALRLSAESHLERWEAQVEDRGQLGGEREELILAARGFLECRCVAPASRRSWEGLGEVYREIEWTGREARSLEPFEPGLDAWSRVGRPGRIAIGMTRGALALAPYWYSLLDDLALTFWAYGLEEEARRAVADSASSLPVFYRHGYPHLPNPPQWMLDTFAEGSRAAVGQVPLLASVTHLLDLGKLELQRGAPDLAVSTLRAALRERGDTINRAEAEFNLGLSLLALGQVGEGRVHLETAATNPLFRSAALGDLARAAERSGDLPRALQYLRSLRQEDPRNLEACLSFAEVARKLEDWPAAVEALRWARLIHPEDPRPHIALIATHLDMGDFVAAATLLEEVERWIESPAEIARLRSRIAAESGGR